MHVEHVPSGLDFVSYSFVFVHLNCNQCWTYHALHWVVIGDKDYLKMLRYSNEYVQFQLILSFAYLVAHISHIEQKIFKHGAVSKGHMPFLQMIPYKRQNLIPSNLFTVPCLCKTIVGIFHSHDHYAIAHIDHSKSKLPPFTMGSIGSCQPRWTT